MKESVFLTDLHKNENNFADFDPILTLIATNF